MRHGVEEAPASITLRWPVMVAIVFLVQLGGHLLGDWVARTDRQATNKTRSWAALAAHVDCCHLIAGCCCCRCGSWTPLVALNHAVAVAMVRGPRAGLDLLGKLEADERVAGDHRLHAVRAHLLEMAGDPVAARDAYLAAARQTTSLPQQRYLHAQAARLADDQ